MTLGAASLSGIANLHDGFDLPLPMIRHTTPPHRLWNAEPEMTDAEFSTKLAADLEQLILAEGPHTVAAFIAEPIQAAGGVLFIADEVVTAFGRLGTWFGSDALALETDLITVAKGITSAYAPLSACIVSEDVWRVIADGAGATAFGHGYTYSSHPLSAAAAMANLNLIEQDGLMGQAAARGAYMEAHLREAFADHPLVGEVRGRDLIAARWCWPPARPWMKWRESSPAFRDDPRVRRLGLIVNPIAGMGGRVGLKGTDGQEALRAARERGATPSAHLRAGRALARLATGRTDVTVLAAGGEMGAELGREYGWDAQAVTRPSIPSGPEDTSAAAAEMLRLGVDLLMFAGGDGTARDIHDAVGAGIPVLGIPSGVKMHSGVFATSPEAAAEVALRYLRRPAASAWLRDAEVADVDEAALADDRISTRLYGRMRTPDERSRMLGSKTVTGGANRAELAALCRQVAAELEPGRLYILGPGTTTALVLDALDLHGTLLGVDAVRHGELVGRDLGEAALLALLEDGPATVIAGVVGGQGCLFGRGNQQISAEVLRRVGLPNLVVIASVHKLHSLSPAVLRVDTGDESVDRELAGYVRVRVAPRKDVVMKVSP